MKLIISLLLLCSVVVVVQAGFCDKAKSYGSGNYCKGDGKTLTYCSCKTKKKKRSCSNQGERTCGYKCSLGACRQPPTPKPANEVCATTSTLPAADAAVTTAVTKVCPKAFTYKTWKDKFQAKFLQAAVTDSVTSEYDFWYDTVMKIALDGVEEPPMNYTIITNATSNATQLINVTDGSFSVAQWKDGTFQKVFPDYAKVWDDNACETGLNAYACAKMIPACKNDKGDNTQCTADCKVLDTCVLKLKTKCDEIAKANTATRNFTCQSYATLYPEFVEPENDPAGVRTCGKFCNENQNDKTSSGLAVVPSVALVGSLIALFY